jgi:hypothetical protein
MISREKFLVVEGAEILGRVARVLYQVFDHFGVEWDVREERPTGHGFDVLMGWPTGIPRGQGGGGVRTILTTPLADWLEMHRSCPAQVDLPVGRNVVKRLRRALGHDHYQDIRKWWLNRFDDLVSLTLVEFSDKHGVSMGAADNWRRELVGHWFCKQEKQLRQKHIRESLHLPTCMAAERLELSAAQVRKLKQKMRYSKRYC